jgi:hypothetical protein
MAALEILQLLGGLAECWCWFSLTGSCLVWMVTFGSVWLEDDHPHWAALVGMMLHVAVLTAVVYFCSAGSQGKVHQSSAGKDSVPAQKGAQ